jgi:hypothetical protein
MFRLQIPQSTIPAIHATPCRFHEIQLNGPDAVRYENYLPDRGLPPAPECAELNILKEDAVEFYIFLSSVKKGAVYRDLGIHTESYLALEKALRPFCSVQLEWLDDGEGMQQIWGPGWMVVYHRFTDRDRTDMVFIDHEGGSMTFHHGDHRDAYQKVAHLGLTALKAAHWNIPYTPVKA